ncbi:hypothetical protein TSOC_014471, partial [Tetrabaena socialis]
MAQVWSPDIIQCVARHTGNDTPFLRGIDKTARAELKLHTKIRLSQPISGHEFARWTSETAPHTLTRKQQADLGGLTARSGSLENMEHLLTLKESLPGLSIGRAFEQAALTGNELMCTMLLEDDVTAADLDAAAEGGNRAICEEILMCTSVKYPGSAAGAAASQGHVDLMHWLCIVIPSTCIYELLLGAAKGCDLPTLQQLYEKYAGSIDLEFLLGWELESAAAGSKTPDWLAKVIWLESILGKKSSTAYDGALKGPDWHSRFQALREHGYPIDNDVVAYAASHGNTAAVSHVLSCIDFDPATLTRLFYNRPTVQLLLDAGVQPCTQDISNAVRRGDLETAKLLVEVLGLNGSLDDHDLLSKAIPSGNMELLRWLLEQGCQLTHDTFHTAVAKGSLEQ